MSKRCLAHPYLEKWLCPRQGVCQHWRNPRFWRELSPDFRARHERGDRRGELQPLVGFRCREQPLGFRARHERGGRKGLLQPEPLFQHSALRRC